nr:hypothetical protein [Actinomycetota bacterium]
KTGTTQNNVDAWFIGATPDYATGVWVGHATPKPMSNVHGRAVTGGAFPSLVFSDVMKASHEGVPVHRIPTVSPDKLGLHKVGSTAEAPVASTSTTETTAVVEPTTTQPNVQVTTTTGTPRTTRPPRPTTTTTTAPPSATTTTVAAQKKSSTATTTPA